MENTEKVAEGVAGIENSELHSKCLQKYVILKRFEEKRYFYPSPSPLPCSSFSQTKHLKRY